MQSKTIINLLRNETISKFIGLHINQDAKKLVFDAKKYKDFDIKTIASLIKLYQKAKIKLPQHFALKAALNLKSYEQCTSEKVAIFKSSIMEIEDKEILNITGGLGIDDWAFSKKAKQIISCEIDSEINDLALYNIELFGLKNIKRILADSIEYIENINNTDIIYADPDRRSGIKKTFIIEDCKPDISKNLNKLLDKSEYLWIKLSPMADLTYLKRKISHLNKIYVIALNGELKEILLCCTKKNNNLTQIFAVSIDDNSVLLFNNSLEKVNYHYNSDGKYLYEPCKSLVKADLVKQYASQMDLEIISDKSNLYVSNNFIPDFQGKSFEIVSKLLYKPAEIKNYLLKNKINYANITSKNFYEKAEELWKRYKLKTGGNDYLYFTIDNKNHKFMYHCVKI